MSALGDTWRRVRDVSASVDAKYRATLGHVERVEIERHSLGSRLSHWAQAVLFFTLLATGLMIYTGWYGPLADQVWGGYYKAFGLHMWAGTLLLAVSFVLFPFYHVVVDGHGQLIGLDDVKETLTIGAAFVGLRKYVSGYHHARRTWDVSEGDWLAHHPAQKGFWWMQMAAFAVLATTGFAMYDRLAADAPVWVGWLAAPAAWLAWETLKQVHLFFALAFTGALTLHVYFALLRSNRDVLVSMVTGSLRGYVVEGDGGGTAPDRGRDGSDVPDPAVANGGEREGASGDGPDAETEPAGDDD
ncbi:MAG: cytochrome b/b6 domain-containing protein [Haloarculaceae archaeon]